MAPCLEVAVDSSVTKYEKILERVLRGTSDQSISFDDLVSLLRRLGFDDRQRGGSHRIFTRTGVVEILNLQPRSGGQAKPYQVKQVRQLILKYRLADAVRQEREEDEHDA